MNFRILPAGDQAYLVELESLEQTLALYGALSSEPLLHVHSIVPAARTVLVRFNAFLLRATQVRRWIEAAMATLLDENHTKTRDVHGTTIEIPVYYDGEDLPVLAELLNIPVSEVIRRHTAATYTAAFAGFAPGFVYMTGTEPSFDTIPRRSSPRTRVPRGSVALAGNFGAVYPKEGPGGWQLIGTTPEAMWDMARSEPALIRPGMRVRFFDASEKPLSVTTAVANTTDDKDSAASVKLAPAFEVLSAGVQTLFQDAGRVGQTDRGISCSGALDRGSFQRVNRIVGNPSHCTVLENAMGSLQLRATQCAVVCVGGADAPISVTTEHGQKIEYVRHQAIALNPGDVIRLGAVKAGVRSYVAVRGGWSVPLVLESSSYDTLADIGPAPLRAGDELYVGEISSTDLSAIAWEGVDCLPAYDLPRANDCITLDLLLGPRSDWFSTDALSVLSSQDWSVSAQSNRVGLRLNGQNALTRDTAYATKELPSEGTVLGSVQVPSNGQPILFLADHPLTGGYPVIGCVASYHLDVLGQIPAGSRIRFNIVSAVTAA